MMTLYCIGIVYILGISSEGVESMHPRTTAPQLVFIFIMACIVGNRKQDVFF